MSCKRSSSTTLNYPIGGINFWGLDKVVVQAVKTDTQRRPPTRKCITDRNATGSSCESRAAASFCCCCYLLRTILLLSFAHIHSSCVGSYRLVYEVMQLLTRSRTATFSNRQEMGTSTAASHGQCHRNQSPRKSNMTKLETAVARIHHHLLPLKSCWLFEQCLQPVETATTTNTIYTAAVYSTTKAGLQVAWFTCRTPCALWRPPMPCSAKARGTRRPP